MKAQQPDLNPEDKDPMEKLLPAKHLEQKYAERLQTALLRARGKGTGETAGFLGIRQSAASARISRYNAPGIDSLLHDKTRKPGKEPVSQNIKNEIRGLACSEKPRGETHWSGRSLAKRAGISRARASQILRGHGVKPHMASKRNYSNDPDFEKKTAGAVGLYLKPPENAIIWRTDGKSQIQAPERAADHKERARTANRRLLSSRDNNFICRAGFFKRKRGRGM